MATRQRRPIYDVVVRTDRAAKDFVQTRRAVAHRRDEDRGRRRVRGRVCLLDLDESPEERARMEEQSGPIRTPEEQASQHQMVAMVEDAIDGVPDDYRQILVLRGVESLDTAEVADVVGLSEAAVKQRLHRARAMLQEQLETQVGAALPAAFGFLGARCDSVVAGVLARLRM